MQEQLSNNLINIKMMMFNKTFNINITFYLITR